MIMSKLCDNRMTITQGACPTRLLLNSKSNCLSFLYVCEKRTQTVNNPK